jgi:endoglucanase
VASLASVAAAGCGSQGGLTQTTRPPLPTPTPVGLQTPHSGSVYLGAYVSAANGSIAALETSIGRTFALDMHYDTWTTNFPALTEDGDISVRRIPVNSWNCQPTNAQIAAGDADMLIETRALAIKNFGHAVFLRYLWDMNTPASNLSRGACYDPSTDNADGTFSAPIFVAAWRHMHEIFSQENVTNVIWVWSPSAAGSDPLPYYPGNAYVDWVGFDAYDTTGAGFVSTIAPIYATLAPIGKPILLAETGEAAAAQPAFFQDASTALPAQFPLIDGLIYFDANASAQNWSLTPAGIGALATLGAEPYFSASSAP